MAKEFGSFEAESNAMTYREKIERLAYKYWEDEGRPEGKHEEHWLRAKRVVKYINQSVVQPSAMKHCPIWNAIMVAVKNAVDSHGPIDETLVGSVAKRVYFALHCNTPEFRVDGKMYKAFRRMIDRGIPGGAMAEFKKHQETLQSFGKLKQSYEHLKVAVEKLKTQRAGHFKDFEIKLAAVKRQIGEIVGESAPTGSNNIGFLKTMNNELKRRLREKNEEIAKLQAELGRVQTDA